MIVAEHIHKSYFDKKVLNDISFEIPKGQIFGLLGPNGAGKTTLIRILNRIIIPDQGKIWFDGQPLSDEHTRQIGYLPEERGLYRKMKVGEQAMYLAMLKGMSREQAYKELKKWFDKFEVSSWWNKKVEELSKGMAQKVQFICTVLHRPKLLILDEPFSGFDPVNAALIQDEILQLKNEGITIIFSTHNMYSVEHLCQKVMLIHLSQKILEGEVSSIKESYKKNQYLLVFKGHRKAFTQALQHWFEIVSLEETGENIIKATVKATDSQYNGNTLLQAILPHVEVLSFEELLPSMYEIFIEKVKGLSTENN